MLIKTCFYIFLASFFFAGEDFGNYHPPSSEVEISDAQLERATEVLNKLKRAKGILPFEAPFLKISFQLESPHKIAARIGNEIHLQQATYQVCQNMGADSLNALAYLLGHELGHFIHKTSDVFEAATQAEPGAVVDRNLLAEVDRANQLTGGTSILDSLMSEIETKITPSGTDARNHQKTLLNRAASLKVRLNEMSGFEQRATTGQMDFDRKRKEAEADFEGAFIAYLAGFDPTSVAPRFWPAAYNHPFISIGKTPKNYPSLTERNGIVRSTIDELSKLKLLFEMANYLAAIEQYDDALAYYRKISEKFESRELYNNMGVMSMKEAMRCFDKAESLTKFQFPLVLDVESRIPSGSRAIGAPAAYDFRFAMRRINRAIEYFNKSLYFDDAYPAAYLNLSVANSFGALLSQQDGFTEKIQVDVDTFFTQNLIKAESACYYAIDLLDDIERKLNSDPAVFRTESMEISNRLTRSNIHVQLGIIMALQKNLSSAGENFKRALAIDSDNQLPVVNRMIALGETGFPGSSAVESEQNINCLTGNAPDCLEKFKIGNKAQSLKEIIEQNDKSPDWIIEEWSNGLNFSGFEVQQQSSVLIKDEFVIYKNHTLNGRGDSSEISFFLFPQPNYTLATSCGDITRKLAVNPVNVSTNCDVLENYPNYYKSLDVSNGQLMVFRPKEAEDARTINNDFIKNAKEVGGTIFHISEGLVKQWVLFYRFVRTDPPL